MIGIAENIEHCKVIHHVAAELTGLMQTAEFKSCDGVGSTKGKSQEEN